MLRRRVFLAGLAAGFGWIPTLALAAKAKGKGGGNKNANKQKKSQEPKLDSLSVDGTIERVSGGQFTVSGGASPPQGTVVILQPGATLTVTGTASIEFLRPGLTVQFKAQYDGHDATEKVGELAIISPSKEQPLSILPIAAAAPVRGVAPAPSAAKPVKAAAADKSTPQLCNFTVRITSVQGNVIMAQGGGKPTRIELTEYPKIGVSVSDPAYASVGDRISAHGKSVQGKPGVCMADKVQVTMTSPLSGPKKSKA